MLPSLGQWIARSSEVPKGKFLKGVSNNPGGLKIIAMAARGGSGRFLSWLGLPGPLAQQARGGAAGLMSGDMEVILHLTRLQQSPLCLKLVSYLCEVTIKDILGIV